MGKAHSKGRLVLLGRGARGGSDYPFVGLINHFNNLCDNFVACVVESLKSRLVNVTMPECNLDVDLRFTRLCFRIVELRHERRRVSPFSPRPQPD